MNCAASTAKYLLYFFNILVVLSGIVLLVSAIIALIQLGEKSDFLNGKFNIPVIVIITIGSILIVVGFFGCCGAIKENKCMITTYTGLVLVIVLIEIAVGITAFIYRNDIDGIFEDKLLDYVSNYYTSDDVKRATVDALQRELECCGATSYLNYGGLVLPQSCCASGTCLVVTGNYFKQSCRDALKDFIASNGNLIGGIVTGICGVQILVISLSFCLSSSM